jgi:hypothetical protein
MTEVIVSKDDARALTISGADWAAINSFRPDIVNPRMVSAESLSQAIAVLERALAPVGIQQAAAVYCPRLINCYPSRKSEPEYVAAIASAFGSAPAAACEAAIPQILRTCKFLPTVAEVCEALDEQAAPRRRLLAKARLMEQARVRQIEDEAHRRSCREFRDKYWKENGVPPLAALAEMARKTENAA